MATVKVYFDANGGAGAPATMTGTSGTTYALPSTKPTKAQTSATRTITYNKVEESASISKSSDTVTVRTTYTFSRWNTQRNGTGTNYYPGQSFKFPTANIRLYAIYTASSEGSAYLPTGLLEQQVLVGWSTTESGNSLVGNPYMPSKDITLYAVWAPEGTGGYLKFPSDSDLLLNAGDRVYLTGFHHPENDGPYTVAAYHYSSGIARITFTEDFAFSGSQDGTEEQLKIYGNGSYVPDLDYICSLDNRLWGCSSKTRTIYASALGDPTDFWTFGGDALDAYQVAVGSKGDFTGCCAMNSNILFFKQHTIHKMLGSYPAEYKLYTYDVDGASDSNGLSAINCDGTVIFVTEHGIGTYSGASAGKLSPELGEGNMHDAMSMYNGEQYYLHFADDDGEHHTYVYDLRYNVWLEQNYDEVLSFAHLLDKDYVIIRDLGAVDLQIMDKTEVLWDSQSDDAEVQLCDGEDVIWSNVDPEEELEIYDMDDRMIWPNEPAFGTIYQIDSGQPYEDEWFMLFKPFYEMATGTWGSKSHIFEKKRYTGITFRLELPEGSWIKAELKSDDGRWIPVARRSGRKDCVQDFVIRTPRLDKAQLRLSGQGPMTILGMEREYTVGSRR